MRLFGKTIGPKPQASQVKVNEPPAGLSMVTLTPDMVVEPFGKINTWTLPNGGKRVRAYFLMENPIEGMQTGVAIDGSGSMQANFGKETIRFKRQPTDQDTRALQRAGLPLTFSDPRTLRALVELGVLEQVPPGVNIVQDQARQMTSYLSKFDADGGTTVTYWATGDGKKIEVVGDFTGAQCSTAAFGGPSEFGDETHLLPAIRYFVERFIEARWGMYVFITDGAINDLDAVKRYCVQLAKDIARGKRNNLKFVLLGVGDDVDEDQMEQLDDLETGTNVDLWDHKIAREMKQLAEIFAEVVSETVILVPSGGLVRDASDVVVKDYRDQGLPALLWFDLPPESRWFTLEVGGQRVIQPLEPGAVPKPVAPSPVQATTVPCVECRTPLPPGTAICPRCGVSQTAAARPTVAAPPAPAPTAPPAPPVAPAPSVQSPPASAGSGRLTTEPQVLDFGAFNRWRNDLPVIELHLKNETGKAWSGTVSSTLPWLDVAPTSVSCPAGGEALCRVSLTAAGGRLKPRIYSVEDALLVEGGGQRLSVAAQVDTR